MIRKFLLLLLLMPLAHAAGLNDAELDLGLEKAGIELFGTDKFYDYKDIAKTADKLKTKELAPNDYLYKAALYAAEMKLFSSVVVQKRSIKAAEQRAAKSALKELGLTSTVAQTMLMQGGSRLAGKLALYKAEDAMASQASLLDFLSGIFLKRPTPGGLRAAARQAIYLVSEDYAYALSQGADPSDQSLVQARGAIRRAAETYLTYTGFLDAITLTYSVYAPEGYNRILGDCVIAADLLQDSLSPKAKSYELVAH